MLLKRVHYQATYAERRPEVSSLLRNPAWDLADTLTLYHVRPEGSDHRPLTAVRLLHDGSGISGRFEVEDRYLRCVQTGFQSPVDRDSCVEFFVQPNPDKGHFNFEFGCGSALRCSYIVDPTRTPEGFRDFVMLSEDDGEQVIVRSSLPETVEPEISGPVT